MFVVDGVASEHSVQDPDQLVGELASGGLAGVGAWVVGVVEALAPGEAVRAQKAHCQQASNSRSLRMWRPMMAWEVPEATAVERTDPEAMNLLIKKVKRLGHGFRPSIET